MIKLFQDEFTELDANGNKISKGNCLAACVACLLEIPIKEVPRFQDLPPDGSWFIEILKFFKSKGYRLESINYDYHPDGYILMCGPSPRGNWDHCVIYKDGKLEHDPYEGGNGVLEEKYSMKFIKNEIT